MKSQFILSGLIGLAGLVSAGRSSQSGDAFLRRHMPEFQTTHHMRRRAVAAAEPKNQTGEVLPPRFRDNGTE
ncbi:hypothetical protein G3M48_009737, partial [Beauveria asiatica]